MASAPADITKSYPPRGPLQQFRLAQATPVACFRCGLEKKSKLQTIYGGDWTRRLCNGCYGRLLSIYEVAAGTAPDDAKADALAAQLLDLVSLDDARAALRRREYALASERHLSPTALRFLGTAEFIAGRLAGQETLEWSPAVIGLCKALEQEVIERLLMPVRDSLTGVDLSVDIADKDLRRVARWCAGQEGPPELGAVSHVLQTAAHSKRRAQSSPLIRALRTEIGRRPRGPWLLAEDGLAAELAAVTSRFRNPAAHIEVLTEADYRDCATAMAGPGGLLWQLVDASASPSP